ncbi:Hachiman antiphage defense system protein HamA [Acinetobacter baumannii]|uniref:Hachiman antiphage defense system protein HamA n=1 Tax=Acinetobacter baumannii TaxID=470 RepID=UPI00233EDA0E|nr:Hachiman antiphage defense system protein HamA [Acinetobacter baumannii]EIY0854356.1 DUF1837 domain-containing protein [Acinetobacter baumannii]MDC4937544.1 DUF1837 domain-containing protein [Acinetobacter baumannii]MDC5377468.1 DUF1837 domain-containing protein [Acinetobacter baumannii]MDR9623551.1 Hachiman antiphage defense system protein HamA [Acinetobacter baumannii]
MIESLCEKTETTIDQHIFRVLVLQDSHFNTLRDLLISKLPEYYLSPQSFQRTLNLLGQAAAYEKLKLKFPSSRKIRSGDVGEVISSIYIEEHLNYFLPIRKLQWRDHKDMAMRGDDVIALKFEEDNIQFIKCESKSAKSLSTATLEEARKELDSFEGRPSPHSIDFIIERSYEIGNDDIAQQLETFIYKKSIKNSDVKHLLFVLTKSNPNLLQKAAFDNYKGNYPQISIGFKVDKHAELINEIFFGLNKNYE